MKFQTKVDQIVVVVFAENKASQPSLAGALAELDKIAAEKKCKYTELY